VPQQPYDIEVNGKAVTVTIEEWVYEGSSGFHIVSTAAGDPMGTRVDAYVNASALSFNIMDHLVAVQGNLDKNARDELERDLGHLGVACPDNCTSCDVCRRAYDYTSDVYRDVPPECRGCIAVYNLPVAGWPNATDLSAWYLARVRGGTTYTGDVVIDLNGHDFPPGPISIRVNGKPVSAPSQLGPLLVNGTLKIMNNDNKKAATLNLSGPLYITGPAEIGMDGKGNKPNLTINLNGQAIFVACNFTKKDDAKEALQIGDWCTINGPGAIVVVGDIYFKPNAEAGANRNPVFVLSVSGTTEIQPNVNFLGAIAGKISVDLKSGTASIAYPTGGFGGLNITFPGYAASGQTEYTIVGCRISQQ